MKPTKNPHLFPETFYTASLNSWASAIQRPPFEAQFCFIDWVVHYKAQSSMEHEFLVVYARHPSGAQIVLGVDRNAERPTAVAPPQAFPGSKLFPSATLPSTSYLGAVMRTGTARQLSGLFPRVAYDGVQVSHDGTPMPILKQHGASVPLSIIGFAPRPNDDSEPRRLSLVHLSVLLLTIRNLFPSYTLLWHQCYFFARATCLALMDLYGAVETELDGRRKAATWCGVHVSSFSEAHAALLRVLLVAVAEPPATLLPAGFWALYSVAKLCDGNVVKSEMDRHRIRWGSSLDLFFSA